MSVRIAHAQLADLGPATVYDILRLRIEVFVVEQHCPYPETDGRDLEPDCQWVWAEEAGRVIATLRILRQGRAWRIGRVATAATHRGRGIAERLVRYALDLCQGEVVLDAQSYLREWYARLGFTVSGEEFVEDGIPHLPMRRSGARAANGS